MPDDVAFRDAMKEPESRQRIEDMIAMIRMTFAPIFNDDPDAIPMNQSFAMAAAAMFAGMTAGHMIALDLLKDQDKRRAGEMMLTNFRNGIDLGKREARKAMLEQLPVKGSA